MPATMKKTTTMTVSQAKKYIEDFVSEVRLERQAALRVLYETPNGFKALHQVYGPERIHRWVLQRVMQKNQSDLADVHYRMTDRLMADEEVAMFGEVLQAICRMPVIEVEPLL